MHVSCRLCLPRRSSAVVCVAIVLFFAALPSFAQSPQQLPLPRPLPSDSLTFFKNYFVTGDYVARGVTLRGLGTAGFATGPIKPNPDGSDAVPSGANIVAAFLYWITVESTP